MKILVTNTNVIIFRVAALNNNSRIQVRFCTTFFCTSLTLLIIIDLILYISFWLHLFKFIYIGCGPLLLVKVVCTNYIGTVVVKVLITLLFVKGAYS